MARTPTPGELIAQVKDCRDDMVSRWGSSWKTELLDRLQDETRMKEAWREIAKRSRHPKLRSTNNELSIFGLCFEFIDIRKDASQYHPSPKDQSDRFLEIAKNAAQLAVAVDGTRLNRLADQFLEVSAGRPTPTMATLLEKLSSDAKNLAAACRAGPNILQRPGREKSTRTYTIRRLAVLFERLYGGTLERTLASFAEAILDEEIIVTQVHSALQNWSAIEFDGRGEYL